MRRSTSWTSSTARWCANLATAQQLTVPQRRAASESIVDVMAAIHGIDVDAVGLGELGRKDAYLERQLKRWYRQYNGSKEHSPDVDFPDVDRVHDVLSRHVPQQQGATIVHGDYRLDNCMIGPDGRIVAVLDWELCTLGDPLADLGLLWVYWADPDEARGAPPGLADRARRVPAQVRGARPLRGDVGPRPLRHRFLHRVRLLEAGVHHRWGVLAVRRRRDGHGRRSSPGGGVSFDGGDPGRSRRGRDRSRHRGRSVKPE